MARIRDVVCDIFWVRSDGVHLLPCLRGGRRLVSFVSGEKGEGKDSAVVEPGENDGRMQGCGVECWYRLWIWYEEALYGW